MKVITVVVPTYNEEENINDVYRRLSNVFRKNNNFYFRVLFIDNFSTDNSRSLIKELSINNDNVEYIFNNFKVFILWNNTS